MFPDSWGSDYDYDEAMGNGAAPEDDDPSPIEPPEDITAQVNEHPEALRPVFLRLYEGRA
jgi:hypothetical protein